MQKKQQIEKEEWVQSRLIEVFAKKLNYSVKESSKKTKKNNSIEVILIEELEKFLKAQGVSEEIQRKIIEKLTQNLSTKVESSFSTFYSWLRRGIEIEEIPNPISLIDWKNPKKNFFTIRREATIFIHTNLKKRRRPDILIYVNGLPLAIWELKKPEEKQSSIKKAINQLEGYYAKIPKLFFYCHFLIVSDHLKTYLFPRNEFNQSKSGAKDFYIYQVNLNFNNFIKSFFEKNNFLERLKDYFYLAGNGRAELICVEKNSSKKISNITNFLNSKHKTLKILNLNSLKFSHRTVAIFLINRIINASRRNITTLVLLAEPTGIWKNLEKYSWQREILQYAKTYLCNLLEGNIEWKEEELNKLQKSKIFCANIRDVAKSPELLVNLSENVLIVCDLQQFNYFFTFIKKTQNVWLLNKSIKKYCQNLNFKGKILLFKCNQEEDWNLFFKWKCRLLNKIEYLPTGEFFPQRFKFVKKIWKKKKI